MMKLTNKEKTTLDDLISQLYGTLACNSAINLDDPEHKKLLEEIQKNIRTVKEFLGVK